MVAGSTAGPTVAPSFYISPIRLLIFNLAPVHTSGQNLSSYILCVLLWLGSTFIVSVMYPFGTKTEEAVVAVILERESSPYKRKQVQPLASVCWPLLCPPYDWRPIPSASHELPLNLHVCQAS